MTLLKYFFFKVTLLICIIFAGILLSFLFDFISFEFLKSFVIAGILTYFNFTLGYCAITFASGKSTNVFLIALLGGMILRLFMMVVMVFICLKFLDIRVGVFIFVILFFYIVYMIIEIFYLFMKKGSI